VADKNPEDAFMRFLDPDPDRAREAYRRLRFRLAKYFELRNCDDGEDLADETIRRCIEKIDAGAEIDASNLVKFLFGIAGNVRYEVLRRQKRDAHDALDDLPPSRAPAVPGDIGPRILLKEYLSLLPPDDARTLVRYYARDREELAKELRTTPGALRLRVHRIKAELMRLIEKGRK
jgi:DNA-directed RNA polymerase specialized sigma24 family protein